jgi:hypothetical protein
VIEATVIITTSPSPRHPSTDIIEETIWSIRWHLPLTPIIVCCDGVRPEQEHRKAAYSEYILRLKAFTERLRNVRMVVQPDFLHQAWSFAKGLELVETPLVLVTEHDMKLLASNFPWRDAAILIRDGHVNLIRFGLGDELREEWKQFMLGQEKLRGMDLLLTKTTQWSQRTHLASTAYYREMITQHLKPTDRCYIEDRFYGQCDDWSAHKLCIYTPEGSIQRVLHTDARGGEPKFDNFLEGK